LCHVVYCRNYESLNILTLCKDFQQNVQIL
jgi:hypothetical protein